MEKTDVIQVRVTPEFKAELKQRAGDKSLSAYILEVLGDPFVPLDERTISAQEQQPRMEAVEAQRAPVESPEPPTAVIVPEPPKIVDVTIRPEDLDDKEITRLARGRYGHLPLGAAERLVRKELDADS